MGDSVLAFPRTPACLEAEEYGLSYMRATWKVNSTNFARNYRKLGQRYFWQLRNMRDAQG